MQRTKAFVTEDGRVRILDCTVRTLLTDNGKWKEDGGYGKTLCLIEITIPQLGIKFNFTPSDNFQDELITNWLEAEARNDEFIFKHPVRSKTRPVCLDKKVKRILDKSLAWALGRHNA